MPYLHLLLDCLVKQINMDFRDKGSSSTNSLKVDELRTYRINLHTNIEAKLPQRANQLIGSYTFDYQFENNIHECPYMNVKDMFDINEILRVS